MARSDLGLVRRALVAVLGREGKSGEQGDRAEGEMRRRSRGRGSEKLSVSKYNPEMKSRDFLID